MENKVTITIKLEYDLDNFYGTENADFTNEAIFDDLENTVYDDLIYLMRGDKLHTWAEIDRVEND